MKTNIHHNTAATQRQLEHFDAQLTSNGARTDLSKALGKKGEVMLHQHFLRKNQRPNKKGYAKSNFWSRIRRSTSLASAKPGQATIAIADPAFATHLYGATITPKRSKFLTIPIAPESYGKRVAEMEDDSIFFLPRKRGGGGFLARPNADGSNRLLYFLTRKVTVRKDPDALPPQAEWEAGLINTAHSFLNRRLA